MHSGQSTNEVISTQRGLTSFFWSVCFSLSAVCGGEVLFIFVTKRERRDSSGRAQHVIHTDLYMAAVAYNSNYSRVLAELFCPCWD